MQLVILNGYAAAGKSTLALKFAKKHDFALVRQDQFLFEMNPHCIISKLPDVSTHRIAHKNILSVLQNYMKSKHDILLEGALVSITEGDPIDISSFVEIAKKYQYTTTIITLVADENIRKRRQNKRKNTLKSQTDNKLVKATNSQMERYDNYIVNTTKLSIKKSLEEIEKLTNKII